MPSVMDETEDVLHYDQLGAMLVREMPELGNLYGRELEWWGEETPGPHVVYGDVLTPYIIQLLESGEDAEAIKRAFGLLERLIADRDVEIQAGAVVTVLDRLVGNAEWMRLMKPYLGRLARRAVRDLTEGSPG